MTPAGIGMMQPWAKKRHPPLSSSLPREAWRRAGACVWQPQVGHGYWQSDMTPGPGITLSTFSCPCSPSVAWHSSHCASSPWLMGHFGMTQPGQANYMPPADRSLNAGTAQEARTLSSKAETAKCVVRTLVPGERTPGNCPEKQREAGGERAPLGKALSWLFNTWLAG